jgi:GGDEF domain-containing protein
MPMESSKSKFTSSPPEPHAGFRFLDSLKSNSDKGPVCEISLSLGVARFDPWSYASIGELMVKADQAMYEQKRRRSRLAFEREASTQSQ